MSQAASGDASFDPNWRMRFLLNGAPFCLALDVVCPRAAAAAAARLGWALFRFGLIGECGSWASFALVWGFFFFCSGGWGRN